MAANIIPNKLQDDLTKFQYEFPSVRLFRKDEMLVYSVKGDMKFAIDTANKIIFDFSLNLQVEKYNTNCLPATMVVLEKK